MQLQLQLQWWPFGSIKVASVLVRVQLPQAECEWASWHWRLRTKLACRLGLCSAIGRSIAFAACCASRPAGDFALALHCIALHCVALRCAVFASGPKLQCARPKQRAFVWCAALLSQRPKNTHIADTHTETHALESMYTLQEIFRLRLRFCLILI